MTQPALSRSIKALEEELGQLLFDRIGKKIELTAFGRQTLQRANALLEDAALLKTSGKKLDELFGEPQLHVTCVAFSADGRWLAAGSNDRSVRLWDLATGKEKRSPLRGHRVGVHYVAYSPDGRTLAFGIT